MKNIFGVNSVTPLSKKLKNGHTVYDWVTRQKSFPSFCMRTLSRVEDVYARDEKVLENMW